MSRTPEPISLLNFVGQSVILTDASYTGGDPSVLTQYLCKEQKFNRLGFLKEALLDYNKLLSMMDDIFQRSW